MTLHLSDATAPSITLHNPLWTTGQKVWVSFRLFKVPHSFFEQTTLLYYAAVPDERISLATCNFCLLLESG